MPVVLPVVFDASEGSLIDKANLSALPRPRLNTGRLQDAEESYVLNGLPQEEITGRLKVFLELSFVLLSLFAELSLHYRVACVKEAS